MRFTRISQAAACVALLFIGGCDGTIGSAAARGGHGGTTGGGTGGSGPVSGGGALETPGRTPLRRLTNAQYNQTIFALLGLQGDFAQAFGPDEEVGGFA